MTKLVLLGAMLSLLVLPLHAQNLWSGKVDTFGNFVKSTSNPNANGVVSKFTPTTAITINRIQLQAPAGGVGCSPLPAIKITDGTTSFVLRIPNSSAPGGEFDPVSNDSGPISYAFPAGDELRMTVVQGGCVFPNYPFEISINVQYSTN